MKFAEQMRAAAEAYSAEQFKGAESFTVMKDVCNDKIYEDAYLAGAHAALESELVRGMAEALRCNAVNPKRKDIMQQSADTLKLYDEALKNGGG